MIMLTLRDRCGLPEESIFIAPQHVVSVRAAISGGASVVRMSCGMVYNVTDDRNDIVVMVERALA